MKHVVGSFVESMCGKCNDVMGHTIVAMVGSTVAKVECRICGSVHRYRPPVRETSGASVTMKRGRDGTAVPSRISAPASAPRPAAPRKKANKPDPASQARALWVAMSNKRADETARPYAMHESFAAQELVNHPLFGLGEVRAIIPPDKMDVLFQDGIKRLMQNKA